MPSLTSTKRRTATQTETSVVDAPPRELAYRKTDGIQVALLWQPADDTVSILVEDTRTGVALEFEVNAGLALDAFYHPYAYAP
jgi:hypothetical protein